MSWNTWICPRCRKQNRSNAARCAWCGASIDDAPPDLPDIFSAPVRIPAQKRPYLWKMPAHESARAASRITGGSE